MPNAWVDRLVSETLVRLQTCTTSRTSAPESRLLEAAVAHLRMAPQESSEQICEQLDTLIQLSYDGMRSSSGSTALLWRCLYTDACILRTLEDAFHLQSAQPKSLALSCISRLDHAIVIAGAPGEGRMDIILDIIVQIQRHVFGFLGSARDLRLASGEDRGPPVTTSAALMSAPGHVLRLEHPPSLVAFIRQYSPRPFVIPGYLSDWPAFRQHPWRSTDYLRSAAGPGRVVPIEIGDDYRDDDWTQSMMLWDEFLNALDNQTSKDTRKLYLAQYNLFKQFPSLRDDIEIPDYAYASMSPPEGFPYYAPPVSEDQLILNAWLGPAKMSSPAHTDPYFNLYAQIVGRKTIWLAPPDVSYAMDPYPPPSNVSDRQTHNPAANNINPSMSNTSRVDVFRRRDEAGETSLFWTDAVPRASSVTLEPGDLLFFPPGWWHAMRSEETSFSVSMWF